MIGIFDSGVGGLTIVKQVLKFLPEYKIIYFGDTARVPYGNKSEETVLKYSVENTEFLLKKGVDIIIIACHTASAIAGGYLRKKYSNIPIFDVVGPGLEKAHQISKNDKIGIIGTESTVRSRAHEKYIRKINPKIKIYHQSCPLFVPLVEEGFINRPETRKIARYYLKNLKHKRIDTIVLACTHYPLLIRTIKSVIGGNVNIVDPSYELALKIKKYIQKNPKLDAKLKKEEGSHIFYASDIPNKFKNIGSKILGREIKIYKI